MPFLLSGLLRNRSSGRNTYTPTLSQRAIPIEAAKTTQRTEKLVSQDCKPKATRESHKAETHDTQDAPFRESESGRKSEKYEGEERETQKQTSPLNIPSNLMKSTGTKTVPPSTIQLPVLDLLSSEQNDDTNFDNVEFFQVSMGNSTPLDPLPSEMIMQGRQQVQYQEETIVRPVTQGIGRRGKCLLRLLREVGDLIIGPVT